VTPPAHGGKILGVKEKLFTPLWRDKMMHFQSRHRAAPEAAAGHFEYLRPEMPPPGGIIKPRI
jgi:hypothetical protein